MQVVSGTDSPATHTNIEYGQAADERLLLDERICSKGHLGAEHPHTKYLMEGDTPSFLNLINNGLSDPERPDLGGWGGRYELHQPRTQKWFLEPETSGLLIAVWVNAKRCFGTLQPRNLNSHSPNESGYFYLPNLDTPCYLP